MAIAVRSYLLLAVPFCFVTAAHAADSLTQLEFDRPRVEEIEKTAALDDTARASLATPRRIIRRELPGIKVYNTAALAQQRIDPSDNAHVQILSGEKILQPSENTTVQIIPIEENQ
jgi:hypothetical protein